MYDHLCMYHKVIDQPEYQTASLASSQWLLGCLAFQSVDYERTPWVLFQTRVMRVVLNSCFFTSLFLMRSRSCLPFASTWVHARFLEGFVVLIFKRFLCCPIVCLYVRRLWFTLRFRIKMVFDFSSLPPIFCRRTYVLFTLFVIVCE